MPKTILVDFDGVIHSYTSSWINATTISDPPVEGAFQWLTSISSLFNVAIYSSRSHAFGGIAAMRAWFKSHGMPSHVLARLTFPTTKPPACITIDDRAWLFKGPGTFPTGQEILNFKPWNR